VGTAKAARGQVAWQTCVRLVSSMPGFAVGRNSRSSSWSMGEPIYQRIGYRTIDRGEMLPLAIQLALRASDW